ncbi:hypothetical protein ACJX0J_005108, partial (mitochondrion) [Zea mays]
PYKLSLRLNFHSFDVFSFHDEYCEEIEPDDTKKFKKDAAMACLSIKRSGHKEVSTPTLKAMTLRATTDEKTRSYNADDSDYERLVEDEMEDNQWNPSIFAFLLRLFLWPIRLDQEEGLYR